MIFRIKTYLIFTFLVVVAFFKASATEPPFLKYRSDPWVIEQLESMSLEERIAQLMMITVYPEQNDASKIKALGLIGKFKPGGILVMQGSPVKTASWINEFQLQSKIPLLVAVDGEWGPSMRIDSITTFPYAQAIGAIQDSAIIYQMGRDIAAQLKLLGIHMNFGPVADINTNPSNPVINFRSYGENKLNVAQKAWWVASGMQDAGVIPVAKHFPGHGDTDTDSHKTLPYLSHSKDRMDTLETFPFRYLAKKGISGIMSAHLNVPSLDSTETPSSLSKAIITNYLKDEIGFTGFVVTDAINMQGVRTEKGNAEVEALKAGNDILEFVPDIEAAIESVKQALINNEISELEIYEKCRTMLALKRWVNLNQYKPTNLKNLTEKLNSPLFEVTNRKLVKGSMTVLKNDGILPVEHLDSFKIASVMIGGNEISTFQKMLSNYTQIDHYFLPQNATEQDWSEVKNKFKNYNLIIGGITGINKYPSGKYGITAIQQKAVSEITQQYNSVFTFFGNAYAIKHLTNIHNANGVILAYQNSELTQELAAQLIFGAFSASGKLPVTIDSRFKVDEGIQVISNRGFSYTIPEEVGINSKMLYRKIDSIAMLGINNEAYPGCQVLIAKDGNIILHKTYGYHTYDKQIPVKEDDLYDWASLTKVTGPLSAIMKLVDEKRMDINMPLSQYWPAFKGSNKEFLSLREILAHQAGLEPFIPFWQMALLDDEHLDPNVFVDQQNDDFDVRVSSHLYMNKNFRAVMYDTIRNSKLRPVKKYAYSDLAFLLFPEVITNITGINYEKYIKENFYQPIGANNITFNPYLNYPLNRIIPTEDDQLFRHETVLGFVHDEGAAMLGGISGNAGLFGTATDLAKIFQMYLQKGYFAGRRYISEKTVNEFTKIQYPENENRRGLGFDKPKIDNHENNLDDAYPAPSSSKNSFGHTGFTGTLAWADPEYDMLFIFMSNRVYPTRDNQMLYELNIRTAMHQSIYDCIQLGLK